MKALSLWQPWATLIALGEKRIETRSWSTNYRGPLAIHAAKHHIYAGTLDSEPFLSVLARHGVARSSIPFGAFVAVAELTACVPVEEITRMSQGLGRHEIAFGNYETDRFAWVLADVKALRQPVFCRGKQGLWRVPDDVRDVIEELS